MGDYMNIHCKLGSILADLKSKHGKEYNYGSFAKRVGVSGTTLSDLINDKQLPRLDTAFSIGEELGMKIEDIWEVVYERKN
jgi:DNA-binding XRE family transcriptional regulator